MSSTKIQFPYPVHLANPVMIDSEDVVVGLRGLAATSGEISFVMNAAIRADKDHWIQGKNLVDGRPFNMWHETPDPEALNLRCRWRLMGEDQYQDDTEYVETWGSGPLRNGSWAYEPDGGAWVGFYLLSYPVEIADLHTFTIEISWKSRGIEPVSRDITGAQLVEALAYASS